MQQERKGVKRMRSFSNKVVQRFTTPLGAGGLEGHEMRTVIFVAVSFQLVFTSYRAIQNLQSSLNEENGLGVISLGVLYAAWMFSGFLTPMVLRFLTTKGALIVSWVCHVLYTTATFYPSWALTVPASFLVGIFSAPLWTAQSLYMTACGYSIAKRSSDSPYHIFSRLNGIFFAVYETSQITGNLISSVVLQNGIDNRTQVHFHQCGRGDCPSSDNATDFEEPEPWVKDVFVGVYVTLNLLGLLMTYMFVIPLPKCDWTIEASTKETVTSFFVTLRHTSIGLLVPMFIFQGMQEAILYSEFTRSYISCPLGIHMVGYVMATHGAITPLTTWLFSRVVKLTGRFVLFLVAGLVNLGLMILMILWTPDSSDRPFIFLAPLAWGVSEGIWLTQSNALVAVQFSRQKESAFAIYHTCRSVGLALTFAYSSRLCAPVKLIIGMVFVLLGLLCYTVSEYRIQWRERRRRDKFPNDSAVSQLALSTVSGLAASLRSPAAEEVDSSPANEISSSAPASAPSRPLRANSEELPWSEWHLEDDVFASPGVYSGVSSHFFPSSSSSSFSPRGGFWVSRASSGEVGVGAGRAVAQRGVIVHEHSLDVVPDGQTQPERGERGVCGLTSGQDTAAAFGVSDRGGQLFLRKRERERE
ncbi:protein unc-93 homolog A-like [Babylonia areolata]|uniref:protein unc-93 homolog A-like n=1 Tax=Babylonia areolata TaxID=304850 RepID=UPI003FD44358